MSPSRHSLPHTFTHPSWHPFTLCLLSICSVANNCAGSGAREDKVRPGPLSWLVLSPVRGRFMYMINWPQGMNSSRRDPLLPSMIISGIFYALSKLSTPMSYLESRIGHGSLLKSCPGLATSKMTYKLLMPGSILRISCS